jgi:hypothetical protein
MKAWMSAAAIGLVCVTPARSAAKPQMLVTKEEAARRDVAAPELRGLFPGPAIKLATPSADALSHPLASPLHLKIDFTPRNGADVDVTNVKLVYLKSPAADLTHRILPSIRAVGLTVPI